MPEVFMPLIPIWGNCANPSCNRLRPSIEERYCCPHCRIAHEAGLLVQPGQPFQHTPFCDRCYQPLPLDP